MLTHGRRGTMAATIKPPEAPGLTFGQPGVFCGQKMISSFTRAAL